MSKRSGRVHDSPSEQRQQGLNLADHVIGHRQVVVTQDSQVGVLPFLSGATLAQIGSNVFGRGSGITISVVWVGSNDAEAVESMLLREFEDRHHDLPFSTRNEVMRATRTSIIVVEATRSNE